MNTVINNFYSEDRNSSLVREVYHTFLFETTCESVVRGGDGPRKPKV